MNALEIINKGPYLAYVIVLAIVLTFTSILVVNTIKDDNVKTHTYSENIDSIEHIDSINSMNYKNI